MAAMAPRVLFPALPGENPAPIPPAVNVTEKRLSSFNAKFNENWETDRTALFHNAITRAFASYAIIEHLINTNENEHIETSFQIFELARVKGSWNSQIGDRSERNTKVKCDFFFQKTVAVLDTVGYEVE